MIYNIDTDPFYRLCLELPLGGVARGRPYGRLFDAFRYEDGWWCFWAGAALGDHYQESRSLGVHCPNRELLWHACSNNFQELSTRKIRIAVGA